MYHSVKEIDVKCL